MNRKYLGTNFICYSKFHVDFYIFPLNNCYCAFCANICLLAEPRGYKFRVFPGQENGLYCWLTVDPLGPSNGFFLWECWSSTTPCLDDHTLPISLSLLCVRAPYFAYAVVTYSLQTPAVGKLGPDINFFLSTCLQLWDLLSWRWPRWCSVGLTCAVILTFLFWEWPSTCLGCWWPTPQTHRDPWGSLVRAVLWEAQPLWAPHQEMPNLSKYINRNYIYCHGRQAPNTDLSKAYFLG